MIDWIDKSDLMDNSIIKRDGTSIDDDYFMATHVPFNDLELIESGETEFADVAESTVSISEEEIYEKFVVNKSKRHYMVIVRGSNGTGKSHLICWLYNKYIGDKEHYNEKKEKVIFLKRLGNTIRGAIQQLIDEDVIQDAELRDKFEKFCNASQSLSEEEFKMSIYSAYVTKVRTDVSNETYKKIKCQDIASFLDDQRVINFMMRNGGPVDRCYKMVSSNVNSTSGDIIFTEADFNFPMDVVKSIKNSAAIEVSSFYFDELRGDDVEIKKLSSYLNSFTSSVIQSCANITSENARDLFYQLRRNLKTEGKDLMFFVEDFTSLSFVESELLTVMAVENGGKNSDLCRATSIIGITDGYYESLRGNFKNRVINQIIVAEQSYGGERFVCEMAARYLNAIYCSHEAISEWHKQGADQSYLPVSQYSPEYEWDYVDVNGKKLTLFPFNKNSLLSLYERLKIKSPRYFLTFVIQQFFTDFAYGMSEGNEWKFPAIPPFVASKAMNTIYSSNVENSGLDERNQKRLKNLLATWGDGTTRDENDCIGSIPKAFLADIGLGEFRGVSEATNSKTPNNSAEVQRKEGESILQPKKDKKDLDFAKRKSDIEAWYDEKKVLAYAADYNKWVKNFVIQAIPWQDEEIAGSLVGKRMVDSDFAYIEDANSDISEKKAVVVMRRNSETRNVLMALTLFDYYGKWDFEDAAYYQLALIKWLEKNRETFKRNILDNAIIQGEQPIVTWALAAEYLQRLIRGDKLKETSDDLFLEKLIVKECAPAKKVERENKDWNDAITAIENSMSQVKQTKALLAEGSKTIMGVVGETYSGTVPFYRTSELHNSLNRLKKCNWNVLPELPSSDVTRVYTPIVKQLTSLYKKVEIIVKSEKRLSLSIMHELEEMIGGKPSEDLILDLYGEIQTFFTNCQSAGEHYSTELKAKFDKEPIFYASDICGAYEQLSKVVEVEDSIELLRIYASDPNGKVRQYISELKELDKFVDKVKEAREKMLVGVEQVEPMLIAGALEKLEDLADKVEKMEVKQ